MVTLDKSDSSGTAGEMGALGLYVRSPRKVTHQHTYLIRYGGSAKLLSIVSCVFLMDLTGPVIYHVVLETWMASVSIFTRKCIESPGDECPRLHGQQGGGYKASLQSARITSVIGRCRALLKKGVLPNE